MKDNKGRLKRYMIAPCEEIEEISKKVDIAMAVQTLDSNKINKKLDKVIELINKMFKLKKTWAIIIVTLVILSLVFDFKINNDYMSLLQLITG
jgi:hypothetical protein